MAQAAIVLSKTRQALVAFITAANVGTANIYDGKRSGDKDVPSVGCGAARATEDPPDTGNFWVETEIILKTMARVDADAVDPKTSSEALSTALWTALETDDLAAQLSTAITDFTCIGVGEDKEFEEEEDGDCWKETLKLKLYCCASDL